MSWIKSWWNYSRIIFLQVAGILLVILNELLPFLLSFDFETFFTREISMLIQLVIQVATIALRFNTNGPVGVNVLKPPVDSSDDDDIHPSPKAN